MKKILFLVLLSAIFHNCTVVNESRKSAGISKQKLFLDSNGNLQNTLLWAHYDATQRGGLYYVTEKGKIVVISEPPPDAGVNSMLEILAKANVNGVDVGAKVNAVKSIAELGKRNASNYVVRDIIFRVEALLNNNGSIPAEALDIYKELLKTTKEVAIAESQAEIHKSKAELLQQLNALIVKSRDTANKDLKLDSTFFKSIQAEIDK